MKFQTLPGFREFYPDACAAKNYIFKVWRRVVHAYGFEEFEAPILEPLELYTEKSGSEIVGQLFNFVDKGGRAVALRPELTPSIVRMVGARANGMPKPIKWFNIGEQFRFERPQKGRLRSFYQLNCDLFGCEDPIADAEMIALAVDLFRGFGLTERDIVVRLSDRTLWLAYLGCYGLEGEQGIEALGIIDKLEREDRAETLKKLQAIMPYPEKAQALLTGIEAKTKVRDFAGLEEFLTELAAQDERLQSRLNDWRKLMGDLEAMEILPFVQIDLGIVRGLAYYTGFVFEVFTREGKSRALAGGGRYDELVEKLGGPALHALGFAIGDVTLQDLLVEKKLMPSYEPRADVFVVIAGEAALKAGLALAAKLRRMQIAVEYSYKDASIGKQLKLADQKKIRWIAICAEDELSRQEILIKDLNNQTQTAVPLEHAAEILRDLSGGALGGCCGGGGCGSGGAGSASGCC